MHVRWEKRRLEIQTRGGNHRLDALLVEGCKEEGAMKDRILTRLGSIEERFLNAKEVGMKAFHRGLFWAHVDKELEALKLEPEVIARIETKISETVPRPNHEWPLWAVKCIPQYEE